MEINTKRKAKNNKPEKIVETEFIARCWQHGFDMSVIESKAVFSKAAGRYLRGQTSESVTDLVGNYGPVAVFVELKAKGKRYQFNSPKNYRQRAFVERKLESGAFVCVSESFDHFLDLFNRWVAEENELEKKRILINDLPKIRGEF